MESSFHIQKSEFYTKNKNSHPTIYIIAGLLYGDEGKGTTTEYLVNQTKSNLVVRYNGGPQAAHHIVLPDRKTYHCFSHFGSGTFLHAHTLMSKYMCIFPHTMLREAKKLIEIHKIHDLWSKVHIDFRCYIITPYHQMLNRIYELLRGGNKKGTTGLGVGVCLDEAFISDKNFFPLGEIFYEIDKNKSKDKIVKKYTTLQIKDLLTSDKKNLLAKLKTIINEKITQVKLLKEKFETNFESLYNPEYYEIIKHDNKNLIPSKEAKKEILKNVEKIFHDVTINDNAENLLEFYLKFVENYKHTFCNGKDIIKNSLVNNEDIIFEGAQGCLLDRVYGIYPHLTKSLCSDDYAMKLLEEIKYSYGLNFNVIKIGVLRAYSSRHGNGPFITNNLEWSENLREKHNVNEQWQGKFKVGPFDIVGANYGIDIFKPDFLSITCIDRILSVIDKDKVVDNENNFKMFNFYLPVCKGYIYILGEDEKEKVMDENLFEFGIEKDETKIITKIKKRKVEEAYCSFDLLRYLKNAKMNVEKVYFNDNYEEISDKDKEINSNSNGNFILKDEYKDYIKFTFNYIKGEEINYIEQYLKFINANLNVPISIVSLGPTFNDKITLISMDKLDKLNDNDYCDE